MKINLERIKHLFLHNWPGKLISLTIAILLWFYVNYKKLPEKSFTIPITLANMPRELSLMDSYINMVKIRIKGPEDVIQTYNQSHFTALVDLKYAGQGQNYLPVQIDTLKKNKHMRIISITPNEISVPLDKYILKDLPVSPTIINSPAEGYVKTEETYYPKTVTVKGPAKIIKELTVLSTKPIDIGGVTGSIYKEVDLDIPNEYIKPYDVKTIQVNIKIKENFKVQNFSKVRISLKDLGDALRVKNKEGLVGQITVRGPAEKLNDLEKDAQFLYIDMNDVKAPGTYKKSVKYSIPWNCKVLKIEPERIDVIVEQDK